MKTRVFRSVLTAAIVILCGCAVGPDYAPPIPTSLPGAGAPAFSAASTADLSEAGSEAAAPPDGAWWSILGDPLLDELVAEALSQNLDLEAARARLRRVDAARRGVSARGVPSLDAGVSAERSRASETTPEGALAAAGLADLTQSRYDSLFSASWEVDLFGAVRRRTEAAAARVGEAEAAVAGVRLGLVAEVARTYVELRGAQRRLDLAGRSVELQAQTARRVDDLERVGLGSKLDAERARALVAGTRARLAPLRTAVRFAVHRLSVLTGRPPSSLDERLGAPSSALADPPDLVPTGLPSELLRRRPDLLAAERRLAAATAEVGAAMADRYPRFFLTGAGGFDSTRFSDLFESASRTWRLGPSIRWPIFQGGQLAAGIDAAEAGRDQAAAEYRQAVLLAVEDVENALVAYGEEELRRRALADAALASARATKLARVVYDRGLESFLTVLDAERTQVEVDDQLAASETGVLLRLVQLYAALGGGWRQSPGLSPAPGEGADGAAEEVAAEADGEEKVAPKRMLEGDEHGRAGAHVGAGEEVAAAGGQDRRDPIREEEVGEAEDEGAPQDGDTLAAQEGAVAVEEKGAEEDLLGIDRH
ncbi:MAG: efflux transporter outer membrane subunit [Acidobacteriota bacterium]